MKPLTRIIVIFVCLSFVQPSYAANPFAALKGLANFFDSIVDLFYGTKSASKVPRVLKDSNDKSLKEFNDPYKNEKKWLTDDNACQKLEDEKNKYYCIEIKYQCADLLISKEEPRFSFGEGHFQVSPFAECADQLREKFKIGLGSFEEEFLTFKSFLLDRETTQFTEGVIQKLVEDEQELRIDDVRGLKNKPQDIAGDILRISVASILESTFKTNEDDLRKVWSVVETQLIEEINKTIKQFYGVDNVITNGFGNAKVPFYTQNFVNRFKRVKTSYQPTETLTKVQLTEKLQKELDLLVNDLNKVNDQIDKITGHTDTSAKTILVRLNEKREKIQEEIFNLKYALKDSND